MWILELLKDYTYEFKMCRGRGKENANCDL